MAYRLYIVAPSFEMVLAYNQIGRLSPILMGSEWLKEHAHARKEEEGRKAGKVKTFSPPSLSTTYQAD